MASGGEAESTALHADLQAVCRLAAGVHNATVQVTGQVAVRALAGAAAAAAEAGVLGDAGTTRGAVQDDVAECQELTEQTRQDAMDTAVCGRGQASQRQEQRSLCHNSPVSPSVCSSHRPKKQMELVGS